MKKYDRMTDEQLIQELRKGDRAIMDYIMDKYKSMVRKKARAMFLLGGENDDLIQEGMIGLIKAVRDYDLSQGNSFPVLQNCVYHGRCTVQLKLPSGKSIFPLNSYISLYEESDAHQDGKKIAAHRYDRASAGNGSGGTVFQQGVYGGVR